MNDTHLAQSVDALPDCMAQLDDGVKRLLADKQILARILKYSVREFMEMSVEDILGCIDDDIEISRRRTEPGLSNSYTRASNREDGNADGTGGDAQASFGRVRQDLTEDNVPHEGKIFFDIRFHVFLQERHLKILINCEAQRSSAPAKLGYHLENRMVFYLARMVSAQKETEFWGSNYDDIKPVISIWICMDTPEGCDSIEEIYFDRRTIFGVPPKPYPTDLMRGVIIRIRTNGHSFKKSKNRLIAMLETLLSTMDTEQKKHILTEDYGMVMTTDLERRVNGMCNISEAILEQGIEQGMAQGLERGVSQGREQGKLETLSSLVKDKILTVAEAARRAGIPEEQFLAAMGKY